LLLGRGGAWGPVDRVGPAPGERGGIDGGRASPAHLRRTRRLAGLRPVVAGAAERGGGQPPPTGGTRESFGAPRPGGRFRTIGAGAPGCGRSGSPLRLPVGRRAHSGRVHAALVGEREAL